MLLTLNALKYRQTVSVGSGLTCPPA